MSDGNFVFLNEPVNSVSFLPDMLGTDKPWKILTVDDDVNYQNSLIYSLGDLVVNKRNVEIITANSATEAAVVLSQHNDISIILLDVVMEQDDAGLRLVETIRNIQGNSIVRIILLTGQPGFAPRQDVMSQYDINEYWNKSEIDHDILKAVISANLRSWNSMYELEQARMGLQMVVDSSRKIASKYDTESFIQVVLKEISCLIGGERSPFLCVIKSAEGSDTKSAPIIAISGADNIASGGSISGEVQKKFHTLVAEAKKNKSHIFNGHCSVLYFSEPSNTTEYLVLVESYQTLSIYHIRILQVFSENISSGFTQIALVNQLSKLAYYDSDVGVKNRNWLLRELELMSKDEVSQLELLVIELDDYDTHAISFKQEALVDLVSSISAQINSTFDTSAVVARVGSDRFAVLYNKKYSLTDEALLDLSSSSYDINGYLVRCTLTFARIELSFLACYPASQILHMARSLLCCARESKKRIVSYEPNYRENLIRDYHILGDLKAAIDNKEFYVVLQPKCDLTNGKAIGLEALLRWKKQETMIPPNVFIPLAERSGLINKLDAIAAKLTFEAIHKLDEAGYKLPISINATVKDLTDPEYISLLLDLVQQEHISSQLVEIEITESQAMESYVEVKPILDYLHEAGFKISIDDFGTGYSSLSHISQLPVDTIKIDISFVTHLHEDAASQQVVDLVMNLANLLDFSVVAEGIEIETQRDALLARGCNLGQGYLYAKPMPLDDLIEWLSHNTDERLE